MSDEELRYGLMIEEWKVIGERKKGCSEKNEMLDE